MKKIMVAVSGMFIGGTLYVVLRSESLTMFRWFDKMAVQDEVRALRFMVQPYLRDLPGWVVFSTPQALWYLSGLLAFDCIWGPGFSRQRQRLGWMLAFSGLAFGLEIGQLLHVVPGRFDPLDLALLVLVWGTVAAIERRRTLGLEAQR